MHTKKRVWAHCPFIRRLKSRKKTYDYNADSQWVQCWDVDPVEFETVKAQWRANTHLEVVQCPRCQGCGRGEWRENRRTGSMWQADCERCDGVGQVRIRVKGKGEDEVLDRYR